MEELFILLDKDKDGFLNFPEFSLLAKGNYQEIMDSNEANMGFHKKMSNTTNYFRSNSVARIFNIKISHIKDIIKILVLLVK